MPPIVSPPFGGETPVRIPPTPEDVPSPPTQGEGSKLEMVPKKARKAAKAG